MTASSPKNSPPAAPPTAPRTPGLPTTPQQGPQPRRRARASHWLTLISLIVIAAQLLTACGPAATQGAAGGMDASLLENATQFGAVPPLTMGDAQPLALPNAGVMVNAIPAPLQSVVALEAVDPAALQQIDPNAAAQPEAAAAQPEAAAAQPEAIAAQPEAAGQPETASPAAGGVIAAAISPDVATPSVATRNGALQGELPALDKTTNILVMGSDRRVGAPNWLTDVMMIVALDYENGRAGVISLPRDIYLNEIAGHQPNKLNVVDYLGEKDAPDGGGPALLSSIIADKMGIRIDHWVRFDFRGFIALVDALGGVEVEIDCPYYDYFSIENVILNVKPGIERLSGDEALVYVRSRKIGGDLDRARRQQRFIWAVRNQVLNENILPKLPSLYNAVSESVQTDIGIVGTLKMARFALNLDKEDITGFVIGYPLVEQGWAGNMWVFLADWDAIRAEVQNVFNRDPFIDTNTLVECP